MGQSGSFALPIRNKKWRGQVNDPASEIQRVRLVVFGRRGGEHIDALAALVELHFAVHEREQSPIATGADIVAGGKFGAALAHEDAARGDELAAVTFHAQPFAGAIAPVADAALTFFMCHILLPYALMSVILTTVNS
jgi:hypothetical protein